MPHARQQRDTAYNRQFGSTEPQPEDIILKCAHYTSAEAALKIIQTKSLWMRNTNCMSDYREVQHGYSILQDFFSKESNMKSFIEALDLCAPGSGTEAIKLFDQLSQSIRFGTYIASMSAHDETENKHGRLSMWRAFGNNPARVAIVLKIPWFSVGARALNIMFGPVAYLTNDQAHKEMYAVIENIHKNCDFLRTVERQRIVDIVFNMLVVQAVCSKHEGFKEEQEWRAIYSPNMRPSNLVKPLIEPVTGVPQMIYRLPFDGAIDPILADIDFAQLFDRLIIGPTQFPVVMAEAFANALRAAGVSDLENRIVWSEIPIRT